MKLEKQIERINSEIDKMKAAADLSKTDHDHSENEHSNEDEGNMERNDELFVVNPEQTRNESIHQICSSPASMCSIEELIPEDPLNQSNLNL